MSRLECDVAGLLLAVVVTTACATGQQTLAPSADPGADGRTVPVGAVSTLDAPKSNGAEPISIEEYLRGRVPGLVVLGRGDGNFTLRLRGGDLSLGNGQTKSPLLVIDGLPIAIELTSQVLRTIRPSEILRIDVLRDVASTSAYGMRGASGVILIRTIGGNLRNLRSPRVRT